MNGTPSSLPNSSAALDPQHPLRSLWHLAAARGRLLLLVLGLAGLASLLTLLQPLLYRAAVNDIAGVFVSPPRQQSLIKDLTEQVLQQDSGDEEDTDTEDLGTPAPTPVPTPTKEPTPGPHTLHQVAPRSPAQAARTLLVVVLALLAVALAGALASAAAESLAARAGYAVERTLILAAFKRALRLPLGLHDDGRASAVAARVDQVDQVSPVVNMLVLQAGPEGIRLVGIILIMVHQSPLLAALALAPLPFYAWLTVDSARRLARGLDAYYDRWQAISARLSERMAGLKTVRASGAERRELEALAGQTREAYDDAGRRSRLEAWSLFGQQAFVHLSRAAVLIVGGWKAFAHQITPGDVVMLVAYIEQVYGPLDSLAGMALALQEHVASYRRALQVAVRPGLPSGSQPLREGPGRVQIRGLRFAYAPGRPVLRGVDAELLPGRLNVLVGPSGSGKSTLAELLLRLRAAKPGSILLDGQDLQALEEDSLRRASALVSADAPLFSGSLRSNLCYQAPEATPAAQARAIRAAGLTPVIARLPRGLDTPVEDGQGGLSLGERQRLHVARALLALPRLLVLDEATANLDAANEARLVEVLRSLRGRCTVLAVAHRPALARAADQVLVLERGRIRAAGPPRRLAKSNAYVKRMLA